MLDARGQVPVTTHLESLDGTELSGWFDVVGVGEIPLVGSAPKGIALSGLTFARLDSGWRCSCTVAV